MAKKKLAAIVKIQIPAGKATPAPPVGTALGPHGVNIMDFVKAFNAKTAKDDGLIIPAVVTIYSDRSYTFITKTPPASVLLKKAAGLKLDKKTGQITGALKRKGEFTVTLRAENSLGNAEKTFRIVCGDQI